MKIKPSPFNIFGLLAIGIAIYFAIFPGHECRNLFITIILFPTGAIGLFLDFLAQRFFTKYLFVFLLEIFVLSIMLLVLFLSIQPIQD